MAFHFDPEILKKHPYATGGVVIVGGIVVFYLISRRSSAGASTASPASGDYAAELQAQTQAAAINASSQLQQSQTQAQLQVAQLQAGVANNQTAAQVEVTNNQNEDALAAALISANASVTENSANLGAQTAQQANELQYAQNTTSMQDAVLTDQVNAGVAETENNNATQLAAQSNQIGYQTDVANLQAQIASQGLADNTVLGQQQLSEDYNLQQTSQNAYDSELPYILQTAGEKQNSALDANDQTNIYETFLSHGNPGVASAAVNGSAAAAVAGDQQNASNVSAVSNAASKVIASLFA